MVSTARPLGCATCWQGNPPHQLEQAAGLLQGLLQGIHAAGQIPQLLLLRHLHPDGNTYDCGSVRVCVN